MFFKKTIVILFAFFVYKSNAQISPYAARNYINRYYETAVNQMKLHKIPASVTLAQAIFESNCGNSILAKKSNNHFGIKCHEDWEGDTIIKDDDLLNECFRKYNSIEDSYADRSLFLKSRARYAQLFNLSVLDYKGWCIGLKASRYATYQNYANELIKIIEDYKLYEIDILETKDMFSYSDAKNSNLNNFPVNRLSLRDFVKSSALFIDPKLIVFKIQLGTLKNTATTKKMNRKIKVLSNIEKQISFGGTIRYTYGRFSDIITAEKELKTVKKKKFSDAFIIATFNDQVISMLEALELLNEGDSYITKATLKKSHKKYLNENNIVSSIDKKSIAFKIQLGTLKNGESPKKMNKRIKDLKNTEKQKTATGIVRYTSGKYESLAKAEKHLKVLERKGFSDAFIIATQNNKIISIQEALGLLNEGVSFVYN